ncbi:hypothetical protein J3F84DRAFT_286232 [Trichoderma pleuroticola]
MMFGDHSYMHIHNNSRGNDAARQVVGSRTEQPTPPPSLFPSFFIEICTTQHARCGPQHRRVEIALQYSFSRPADLPDVARANPSWWLRPLMHVCDHKAAGCSPAIVKTYACGHRSRGRSNRCALHLPISPTSTGIVKHNSLCLPQSPPPTECGDAPLIQNPPPEGLVDVIQENSHSSRPASLRRHHQLGSAILWYQSGFFAWKRQLQKPTAWSPGLRRAEFQVHGTATMLPTSLPRCRTLTCSSLDHLVICSSSAPCSVPRQTPWSLRPLHLS